jgi:uncharacterized protein YkwD
MTRTHRWPGAERTTGVSRPVLAALLVLVVTVTLAPPSPAAGSSTWMGAEQRFTNLLNQERSARDLPTVQVSLQMVRIARDWSQQMSARNAISHRPDVQAKVFGPWRRLGENVGRTGSGSGQSMAAVVDRLHQAFMDSPGHRANVLGDFNQVGVGVVLGPQGDLWVTFNFLKGPVGSFPLFPDIAANAHETSTERAWIGDLARGCTDDRYCPGSNVTRAQMATFLARALTLEPVVSNRFRDVDPRSSHAGAINALVEAGIANGCTATRFCPDQSVDRAQMASFLARALELTPRTVPEFVDVPPTSPHYGNVNAVAREAITTGCDRTELRYCPSAPVKRDQMSSFLTRAFRAPLSFWQAPADDGAAPAQSSDTTVRLAAPTSYERTAID